MNQPNLSYFVTAAIVASELNHAMLTAKLISLTASNARALALRAGQGAAGFSAITDFIDNLSNIIVYASNTINKQAITLSNIATDNFRTEYALKRFDTVYNNAAEATHLSSLDASYNRIKTHHHSLKTVYSKEVATLKNQLDELVKELRTATILTTMSHIEASQSGEQYEQLLNNIAHNVANAAKEIQQRVSNARQLIHNMT